MNDDKRRSTSIPSSEFARQTRKLSTREWGTNRAVHLIGISPRFVEAQERLAKFARVDGHVLLTGESGVGKELFARSLYLHCKRKGERFVSVNCAQYQSGDLLVSELFGHRKGSFTGAMDDREGIFEAADGGVVFLDEVGELSPEVQSMLLRILSEGEIKRLGDAESRTVNVRIVAATNRNLVDMMKQKAFRSDLYYRLCNLHVRIPPLRVRENDASLIARFLLRQMNRTYSHKKTFSASASDVFETHSWPGNVRELQSVIETGYSLCEGNMITAEEISEVLRRSPDREKKSSSSRFNQRVNSCYHQMTDDGQNFWTAVREPFMDRELNRCQVQEIVRRGLRASNGSYKDLLHIFRVLQDDYLKFMDFLRHHELKPEKNKKADG